MVLNAITQETSLHDQAVQDIAEERFALAEWEVVTNLETQHSSVLRSVVPDIVAMQCQSVVAVGEVETEGTVSDERAGLWKSMGESCPRFYLFVPRGAEHKVIDLIGKHEIACAGLRSYNYNGKLEIEPVHIDEVQCKEDDHPWWLSLGGVDNSC